MARFGGGEIRGPSLTTHEHSSRLRSQTTPKHMIGGANTGELVDRKCQCDMSLATGLTITVLGPTESYDQRMNRILEYLSCSNQISQKKAHLVAIRGRFQAISQRENLGAVEILDIMRETRSALFIRTACLLPIDPFSGRS